MLSITKILVFCGLLTQLALTQETPYPQSIRPSSKPDAVKDQRLANRSAPWQEFLDENGPGWIATWNYATETPSAIYGVGLPLTDRPVSEDVIWEMSWDVLYRFRNLLGTGDSTYQQRIAAQANGVHVFVWDQYYEGIPVIGGRADVRINDLGILAMFGSQTFPIPQGFQTTPRIGSMHARAQAYLALAIRPTNPEFFVPPQEPDRLVIWGDVHAPVRSPVHLAWEVAMNEPGQEMVGMAYVDANTGALLRFETDLHYLEQPVSHGHDHAAGDRKPGTEGPGLVTFSGNVRAWTTIGLQPTVPPQNVPLANLRINIPGVGTTYTDANGDFSLTSSAATPVQVTVVLDGRYLSRLSPEQGDPVTQTLQVVPGVPAQFQILTSNPLEFDRSQTTTYWYTNDINEYLRGILSSNLGILNRINSIRANVNLGQSCNAFYRSAEKSINFFASSTSCNNTAFSTIIYHEWGHGLDDVFGGISRVDGLSEGWADIVAIYRSGQPIIGDGFRKNGASVRTALNSTQYPASACDPDSVHCLGQVWMGFAWQVRQRLRSALGTGPGTSRAERIVLGSIVANATNTPAAVREVFILDDDDGNLLNGTPNYSSLVAAALSRSLPYPRKQVVALNHARLGDTDQQLTPRLVTVTATPLSGSVAEMRVIVTPSTTEKALTRTMVPTGVPDEYMALLPGYGSPVTVSYFIESEHSGGSVARLPGTGAFVYRVGKEQVFLFDDFESGDLGWTHGPAGNGDDWQLGAPLGLSGSSSGVPWSDPFTAYSGLNIWGNDLGRPGFNGAYEVSVDNWLRSPNFSTLGQTGLSLRFARWLTVEENQYDQATILVNDQEVWSNAEGNHLLDTDWSLQEIPIPEADDQDSVHIEWRLKTDSSVQFGGWNIDDVQVVTHVGIPLPDVLYRLTPEQTPIGGPMTAFVYGPPGSPALILISDNPGPTILPGIPTLSVGADASLVPAVLDANGTYFTAFAAPSDPALIGELVYSQVLALDGATIVASNPTMVLFTR